MRLFYKPEDKHLIVVPYRNGSAHLSEKMELYELINVSYPPIFNSIIGEVEKKTFIYRDPFLRLISYYNNFIYTPFVKKTQIDKRHKHLVPGTRGKDLLSDIMFAKHKIEKAYKADSHTCPQYDFFKDEVFKQDINDYEIVSVTQYIKWLVLTFADATTKHRASETSIINLNIENFTQLQIIHDMCRRLYKDDYKYLEPKVMVL